MASRDFLLRTLQSALTAVNGASRVAAHLHSRPQMGAVYLIALGKAACPMARAASEILADRVRDALVVTKYGHAEALPWPVREAGHPLPDARSLEAGSALTQFIARMPRDAGVLVLLSGGASALIEQPASGLGLAQLRAINEWLLGAGLDIAAVNAVRSRMSQIKGGRLAGLLAPRSVRCLAISDVPGDDPRVIASGPLTEQLQVPAELPSLLPRDLRRVLEQVAPPPYPPPSAFRAVDLRIIATNEDAKQAAATAGQVMGYQVAVHAAMLRGDAIEAGRRLAQEVVGGAAGTLHVWGGETTMHLPPQPGRGGRNQSLALAAASVLHGRKDILLLAAGTDGSDGPGGDAGALVDGATVARGRAAGLDEKAAIENADAGRFLDASGDLISTGPTETNVMDIVLGLKLPA